MGGVRRQEEESGRDNSRSQEEYVGEDRIEEKGSGEGFRWEEEQGGVKRSQ